MSFYKYLRSHTRTLIVAGATCLALTSPALAAEYVSVSKDKVNVRQEPDTGSSVYMELFQGYPLEVLKKQGEWSQIRDYEGDSGWIHNTLVGKNDTVIINAKKSVNMRSGPSTDAAIVADVERGVIMTKIGQDGKWIKLKHSSGTVGWIYSPLLWPNS
ncbi:SH3 domain-containing protein [Desulfosediminicola ganghwensis]|uniref:SH3 domain-containing protein n=1 Tax=Desulfosediminicola ganghwensis TaxID=2569540 RepID=UPI0010AD3A82|nr:SH3 domain-containing protein [Desulfosediminicola ganghwensis]